jgi:hypothetical protein
MSYSDATEEENNDSNEAQRKYGYRKSSFERCGSSMINIWTVHDSVNPSASKPNSGLVCQIQMN